MCRFGRAHRWVGGWVLGLDSERNCWHQLCDGFELHSCDLVWPLRPRQLPRNPFSRFLIWEGEKKQRLERQTPLYACSGNGETLAAIFFFCPFRITKTAGEAVETLKKGKADDPALRGVTAGFGVQISDAFIGQHALWIRSKHPGVMIVNSPCWVCINTVRDSDRLACVS